MFNAVVNFFQALFAKPQQDELLIPVRVDKNRDLMRRRG